MWTLFRKFIEGESKSSEISTDGYLICTNEENPELVHVKSRDLIEDCDVDELMKTSRVNHYSVEYSERADLMVSKCKNLYDRDYQCKVVDNVYGVLCKTYPARIIVPVAKKSSRETDNRLEDVEFNPKVYIEEISKSNASRVRKRFVVPVIMYNKKFICRSGTITNRATAAWETATQSSYPHAENVDDNIFQRIIRNIVQPVMDSSSSVFEAAVQFLWPESVEKLWETDAQIIRDLNVQYICDLMVEDIKMFMGLSVTSSEKINTGIYHHIDIEQMPYPGCEFFEKYHEANRNPEGLIFDWSSPDVTTILKLTENISEIFPDIQRENYKEWDLVELTQNYLKILLLCLAKGEGGILVHCISGWDRTPLFISLLRISLWADGVIHQSLNYQDMAYLTLTYDWYLFGHNLPARLGKKEEIMHFCFNFLQYIVDDKFSITRICHMPPVEQQGNDSIPDFTSGKRKVISDLRTYVLNLYDQSIQQPIAT